jgi:hypothetical protein
LLATLANTAPAPARPSRRARPFSKVRSGYLSDFFAESQHRPEKEEEEEEEEEVEEPVVEVLDE